MHPDLPYWLALLRFRPFGPKRLARLSRAFSSMSQVLKAPRTDLLEAGIEEKITEQFLQTRTHLNPDEEYKRLESHAVSAVLLSEDAYPALLKEIFDPPPVLFYRGTLPSHDRPLLSVVGARKSTPYGARTTQDLIGPIAKRGVGIVSGLAYGIDAHAHHAAVQAGGVTYAVLAGGVDHATIYPSQHRHLATQIMHHGGALLSEYLPETPPLRHQFPLRNRIIAGLSQSTLIVEATKKSGSLITARAALESNRDVYAVPGSIHSPLSEGPNTLLKMGAIPVTEPSDLFPDTEPESPAPSTPVAHGNEALLYNLIGPNPIHVDELRVQSDLETSELLRHLTLLEMKGAVRHVGGRYYTR